MEKKRKSLVDFIEEIDSTQKQTSPLKKPAPLPMPKIKKAESPQNPFQKLKDEKEAKKKENLYIQLQEMCHDLIILIEAVINADNMERIVNLYPSGKNSWELFSSVIERILNKLTVQVGKDLTVAQQLRIIEENDNFNYKDD